MQQDPPVHPFLTLQRTQSKKAKGLETLVWAGKKSAPAFIYHEGHENCRNVTLNRSLAANLCLPLGSYGLFKQNDGSFRVGPVVGIITSSDHEKPFPTGKNARLFRELFEACKSRGVFLFEFYPDGVRFKSNTIKGYSIDSRGGFYSSLFPIPDIVYNRIRYRVIENRSDVKRILTRFDNDSDIYLFNTRFLNKLEVYRVLRENTTSQLWIPETAQLTNKNLKVLLGKYNSVYIKPIANSRGKGILKLSRGQRDEYSIHHAASIHSLRRKNISNIYTNLKQAGLKSGNYLVQKAIPLASYRGRVFDLRVQAQKNGKGKWVLTGAGVRVAGPNRIVTHIPNGGSAKAYETVIQEVFGHMAGFKEHIDDQLLQIVSEVPAILESSLNIQLAILSMDIGVDQRGKLWLIEVNSKPASFDEDFIRAIHTRNLAEYFIFAAINKRSKGMIKRWN